MEGCPEGYRVLEHDCTMSWCVMKIGHYTNHKLQNSLGRPKTFRSEERALAYAQAHAALGLSYTQEVPKEKGRKRS